MRHCPVWFWPVLVSTVMRRLHFLTLSISTIGGAFVCSLDRKPLLRATPEKTFAFPFAFLLSRKRSSQPPLHGESFPTMIPAPESRKRML